MPSYFGGHTVWGFSKTSNQALLFEKRRKNFLFFTYGIGTNRRNVITKITIDLKSTRSGGLRCSHVWHDSPDLWQAEKRKPMAEARHSGNPGNFAEDRARASRAGQIGGQHSAGNFANDRQRAVEAGRKGGRASRASAHASQNASSSEPQQSAEPKSATFAQDHEKAASAGRKGGQTSH
jgi:general stress protein YciG